MKLPRRRWSPLADAEKNLLRGLTRYGEPTGEDVIERAAQGIKVEAEKRAELEAPALAQKAKVVVDAEAEAERRRIEAEGEAKAIFLRLEAEGRGQYEVLKGKADGLRALVESCGSSQAAFQMLMLEHLDKLAETAASAIANVKFDKVVVWDGGGENGGGAAGFVRRLGGMLPPMMQIMKDIGGVDMPEYFGKLTTTHDKSDSQPPAEAPTSASSDGKGTPTSGDTGSESVATKKMVQKDKHDRFKGEQPPKSGRI